MLSRMYAGVNVAFGSAAAPASSSEMLHPASSSRAVSANSSHRSLSRSAASSGSRKSSVMCPVPRCSQMTGIVSACFSHFWYSAVETLKPPKSFSRIVCAVSRAHSR